MEMLQLPYDEEIREDIIKKIRSMCISKAFSEINIYTSKNIKQGVITCPMCGKELSWVRHSNGHLWGMCETENCLSWMG